MCLHSLLKKTVYIRVKSMMKKISNFFCDVFVWKWGLQAAKKAVVLTMESRVLLKKRHFFAFPWVPNCIQNLKEGWKFFIPKMFDSYRIVPKVLEEMNGNDQKMPLLVTLKFLVQLKMQFPVKFKEKSLCFIQLFYKCYPWLSTSFKCRVAYSSKNVMFTLLSQEWPVCIHSSYTK